MMFSAGARLAAPAGLAPRSRRALACVLAVLGASPELTAVDRSRQGGGGGGKDDYLTGVWGGRRTALFDRGIDLGVNHTAAVYENVSGGLGLGRTAESTADLSLDLDFAKLTRTSGLRLHASAVTTQGTSISQRYVGDVNKISSLYAAPGFYLNEVWLEKTWLADQLSLRAGKLALDMEFPVYSYADAIPVPLYPTGGLGLRLRYAPNDRWSFQTAIFDGDPYAPGRGLNPHGTHLRLAAHDGATLAAELALNLGVAPGSALPPGTWKLGAYHNTRLYPDVTTGSLHRGNLSGYVNGDHTLWQENPSKKDDAQGLALYAIAEWAQSDRNTYRHGFGGGPYYTGVFPGRDRDVAYLNVLYTRFSPRYAAASRAAGGPHYGVETRWQFNYQIVLTPYFSLTPEINYVVSPGGTGRVPHTTVFGLRSKLSL